MNYNLLIFLLLSQLAVAQSTSNVLAELEDRKHQLEQELNLIQKGIDSTTLKLEKELLLNLGTPSDNYLEYVGYYLEYSDEHKQALWTMHVVNPNVVNLGVGRSNDFRVDTRIKTGTADSIDYFRYDSKTNEY